MSDTQEAVWSASTWHTPRETFLCNCMIGISISRFGAATNISTAVRARLPDASCMNATHEMPSCRGSRAGGATTKLAASACRQIFRPSRERKAGSSAIRRYFRQLRCGPHWKSSMKRPCTVCDALANDGIICDWREPDILRVAPVPLYNTFSDLHTFADKFLDAIHR